MEELKVPRHCNCMRSAHPDSIPGGYTPSLEVNLIKPNNLPICGSLEYLVLQKAAIPLVQEQQDTKYF